MWMQRQGLNSQMKERERIVQMDRDVSQAEHEQLLGKIQEHQLEWKKKKESEKLKIKENYSYNKKFSVETRAQRERLRQVYKNQDHNSVKKLHKDYMVEMKSAEKKRREIQERTKQELDRVVKWKRDKSKCKKILDKEWDKEYIDNLYRPEETSILDKFFTKKTNENFAMAKKKVENNESAFRSYCDNNSISVDQKGFGKTSRSVKRWPHLRSNSISSNVLPEGNPDNRYKTPYKMGANKRRSLVTVEALNQTFDKLKIRGKKNNGNMTNHASIKII